MTDNVGYTPGSGESIATDDIGGVQFQRVKLTLGSDGNNDGDASSSNPVPVQVLGEAIEAIEAIRFSIQALTRSIGLLQPDSAARMRVAIEAISGGLTLATISTVSTVTTLANQTQIGGFSAAEQIPALMRLGADSLRRNISVT